MAKVPKDRRKCVESNKQWYNPTQVVRYRDYMWGKFDGKPYADVDVVEKKITYFDYQRETAPFAEYDHYFAYTRPGGYDQRKVKDNGPHMQDIRRNIFNQEKHKAVPVLTSLNYGRRPIFETIDRTHSRVHAILDFYRPDGIFYVDKQEI